MICIKNINILTLILILILTNLNLLNCNSEKLDEKSKQRLRTYKNNVHMPDSIIKTEGKKQLKKKRVKFAEKHLNDSIGTEPLIESNPNQKYLSGHSRKQRRNSESASNLQIKSPQNGNAIVIKFTILNFTFVSCTILYHIL